MINVVGFSVPDQLWGHAIDEKIDTVAFNSNRYTFFYSVESHTLDSLQEIWRRAIGQLSIHLPIYDERVPIPQPVTIRLIKQGNDIASANFAFHRVVPSLVCDSDSDSDQSNPVANNSLWDPF